MIKISSPFRIFCKVHVDVLSGRDAENPVFCAAGRVQIFALCVHTTTSIFVVCCYYLNFTNCYECIFGCNAPSLFQGIVISIP